MSTPTARPGRASSPTGSVQSLGPVGMLRWGWTQLTSMRTALALLFLLALGAIPGSLIPQRGASMSKVTTFRADHPALDRIYQPLGLYDVYSSPWFSAIYLLLFVSLIGCIVPRIRVYWQALRGRPARVPSRLDRLPEHRAATLALDPATAVASAEQWLRRRRFRTERHELADGSWALSAERGYLREFGNLLFHTSLVVMLVGVAWNNLLGFKGSVVLVEGQGFSNVITQYDEYHAGAWVDTDHLEPFTLKLKKFTARFETGPVQTGAAREFDAQVDVTDATGTTRPTAIRVNHPLHLADNNLYLLGHGYAAHVTVVDGQGNTSYSGPVVFLPQDGNFTSSGVVKAPDSRPYSLAFEGLFLPTAPDKGMMGHSIFPDAGNPQLFLNAWWGAPKPDQGRPESIYTLDKAGMTQFHHGDDILRFRLKPGEGYTLPDGKGSVVFDGWSRWTKMQISHAPGLPLAFGSIAAAVLGLCLSLFVRPRRLWLRTGPDGTVEVGGLDRADARTGLADDVDALLAATGTTPVRTPEETA